MDADAQDIFGGLSDDSPEHSSEEFPVGKSGESGFLNVILPLGFPNPASEEGGPPLIADAKSKGRILDLAD